jgi:hypothetical protein
MNRCDYSFYSSSSSSWILKRNKKKINMTYMQIMEQVILSGACRGKKKTEVTQAWNFPEYGPSLE